MYFVHIFWGCDRSAADSKEDDDEKTDSNTTTIKLSSRPSDPPPKPKKNKKKAKTRTVRASTEATVSMATGLSSPSTNAPQPPKKTKVCCGYISLYIINCHILLQIRCGPTFFMYLFELNCCCIVN